MSVEGSSESSFPAEGKSSLHKHALSDKTKLRPDSRASRVVANLSEERLARKRAADRLAQQVLRQKNRQRIEHLEQRIQELTSNSRNDSALRAAQARTVELEEELRQLRRDHDSFLKESQREGFVKIPASFPITSSCILKLEDEDVSMPRTEVYPATLSVTDVAKYPLSQLLAPVNSHSLLEFTPSSKSKSLQTTLSVTQLPMQLRRSRNKAYLAGFDPASPTSPYILPTCFVKQPSMHAWDLPLSTAEPVTPIDHILNSVIQQQKYLAAKGASQALVRGPKYPNINVLVAPQYSSLVHPVARALSDLLSRLTCRSFIDKLGSLMIIYPIYQWQIAQSYESFAALPSYNIPILSQRTTLHPVWICGLGWPRLRKVVIENQEKYCTEEFQYMVVHSANINWPHGIKAALRRIEGGFTVSKEFWEHARNLDNWSLDEPFQSRYPELEEFCKFTKYPDKEKGQ